MTRLTVRRCRTFERKLRRLGLEQEIAELYLKVGAEPANLDVRAVLGDLLQLAGDPRGDFIALQLAIGRDVEGNLVDDAARRRAAALLAAHGDAWTAKLPGVVPGARRFANGFLVAMRTRATAAELEASFGDPTWATVEELAIECQPELGKLMRAMPLLHALHVEQASTLADLAQLGPHAGLRAISSRLGAWLPADRAQFPKLEVAGVQISPSYVRADTSHRATLSRAKRLRLHALVVGCHDIQRGRLLDARGSGPELRFVQPVAPVTQLLPRGWWVRLPRNEPRAEVTWGGGSELELDDLPRALDGLEGRGIENVTVSAPGAHRARVRYLLERVRVAVRWERDGFALFGGPSS